MSDVGFFWSLCRFIYTQQTSAEPQRHGEYVPLPLRRGVCEACGVTCPLCQQRKAKRTCPALGQSICTVCCATKRLVVIDCPRTAPSGGGREHPAAVVLRQQEADVAALLPSMSGLTERQHQLFFLFQSVIAKFRPDGLA